MKTKKLYDDDSYLKHAEAKVVSSEIQEDGTYLVEVDSTIFFPEGGGQPSDRGTMEDASVSHVFEQNGTIYHVTDKGFQAGDKVHLSLDFKRRFDHMQQHTGEHILSSAFENTYHTKNVGFHMNDRLVTIHLDRYFTKEEVAEAEILANQYVVNNHSISTYYPSEEELSKMKLRKLMDSVKGPVRVVDIEWVEQTACCGTHCDFTSEVGLIKVLNSERYKGGTKIDFVCGNRALLDYRLKHDTVTALDALLSVQPADLLSAVEKLYEEKKELKKELAAKNTELFGHRAKALWDSAEEMGGYRFISVRQGLTVDDAKFFNKVLTKYPNVIAACYAIEGDRVHYILGTGNDVDFDCKTFCLLHNEVLDGKGGGNPVFSVGSAPVPSDLSEKLDLIEERAKKMFS